jgi:hypothetical protein
VNVGQTLLEELPDLDDDAVEESSRGRGTGNGRSHYPSDAARSAVTPRSVVAERPAPPPSARPAGAPAAAAAPAAEGAEVMLCSTETCGKPLTKGQYEVSLRAFGLPLCPACQKAAAAKNS